MVDDEVSNLFEMLTEKKRRRKNRKRRKKRRRKRRRKKRKRRPVSSESFKAQSLSTVPSNANFFLETS